MYVLKTVIAIAVIFFAVTVFADNNQKVTGQMLFKQHCKVCHGQSGGMNKTKRIAPPIAGVKMHYISIHKEKDAFVNAITSWLEQPDASKSLMPGAIRHFNVMPLIPVPKEDAQLIAEYIYEGDIEIPAGYKKHYEQNHGQGKRNQDLRTLARHLRLPLPQLQRLNLSEEQITKIKALIVEKEVIMQPLREEVLEFNQQLNTMDSRAPDYKANIFALADVNAKRVEQMVVESGEMRMKIEAVLDQTQYRQLLETRNQMKKRHKHRLKQQMQTN